MDKLGDLIGRALSARFAYRVVSSGLVSHPLLLLWQLDRFPKPSGRVTVSLTDHRVLSFELSDRTQRTMFLGLFEPSETRLVRELLGPGDTFVDVGAHVGWFTTLASQLVGSGLVESIEPFEASLALLKANIDNNRCTNVRLRETAVGGEVGALQIAGSDSGGVTALEWRSLSQRVTVPVVRMDDLDISDEVSLMKIDVEGWEANVLRGGQETLSRTRNLLIEVSRGSLMKAGSSPEAIFGMLRDAGFTSFYRVTDGIVRERYLERRAPARAQNVFATRTAVSPGADGRTLRGLSRRTLSHLRPLRPPRT
jgi:FkbM family methyltransferase